MTTNCLAVSPFAIYGWRHTRPVDLYPQQNGSVNLEKAKKDLFAMIQQLGPATLVCSFSAAETKWIELLKML